MTPRNSFLEIDQNMQALDYLKNKLDKETKLNTGIVTKEGYEYFKAIFKVDDITLISKINQLKIELKGWNEKRSLTETINYTLMNEKANKINKDFFGILTAIKTELFPQNININKLTEDELAISTLQREPTPEYYLIYAQTAYKYRKDNNVLMNINPNYLFKSALNNIEATNLIFKSRLYKLLSNEQILQIHTKHQNNTSYRKDDQDLNLKKIIENETSKNNPPPKKSLKECAEYIYNNRDELASVVIYGLYKNGIDRKANDFYEKYFFPIYTEIIDSELKKHGYSLSDIKEDKPEWNIFAKSDRLKIVLDFFSNNKDKTKGNQNFFKDREAFALAKGHAEKGVGFVTQFKVNAEKPIDEILKDVKRVLLECHPDKNAKATPEEKKQLEEKTKQLLEFQNLLRREGAFGDYREQYLKLKNK